MPHILVRLSEPGWHRARARQGRPGSVSSAVHAVRGAAALQSRLDRRATDSSDSSEGLCSLVALDLEELAEQECLPLPRGPPPKGTYSGYQQAVTSGRERDHDDHFDFLSCYTPRQEIKIPDSDAHN